MKIGDSASFGKTISEADVYQFAGLTGDFNPLHVNKVEAEKTMFGERIAHGMLVGSLISTVLGMYLPGEGTIYLEQNCKFLRPIKFGDTVQAVVTVDEIINKDKGIVKMKSEVINQNQEKVIDGYSIVKVPSDRIEEC